MGGNCRSFQEVNVAVQFGKKFIVGLVEAQLPVATSHPPRMQWPRQLEHRDFQPGKVPAF